METGSYLLGKSSGFAFSTETNENYRKQDLYKFASDLLSVKPLQDRL